MTTPDAALASVIYGVVWTTNSLLYTAILGYARKKEFAEESAETRRLLRLYVIGALGYLVAIGISFLNIYAAVALYFVIVALYIPPQRLQPALAT